MAVVELHPDMKISIRNARELKPKCNISISKSDLIILIDTPMIDVKSFVFKLHLLIVNMGLCCIAAVANPKIWAACELSPESTPAKA